MAAEGQQPNGHAIDRRAHVISKLSRRFSAISNSEYEPLLPETLEPSLYKTTSVSLYRLVQRMHPLREHRIPKRYVQRMRISNPDRTSLHHDPQVSTLHYLYSYWESSYPKPIKASFLQPMERYLPSLTISKLAPG